jgi:hypothetical protein
MKREIGRTSAPLSMAKLTWLAGGVDGGITPPGVKTEKAPLSTSVTPVAVKRSR